LARVYKRPLAVFYLPEPPRTFSPLHDFRRLPEIIGQSESPELRTEIRRAHYRREVFLELAEDWEDAPPELHATASASEDPERVGRRARQLLDIPTQEQASWSDEYEALSKWRAALEELGILVFQVSGVSIDEMRGFSITEQPFPAIAMNAKDTPAARVFSLMHEFVHVLLHSSSLCDFDAEHQRRPEERRVELFCNAVAAEILVPIADFLEQPLVELKGEHEPWSLDELRVLSRRYKISREVVLRRLHGLRKMEDENFWSLRDELYAQYEERAAKKSEGFSRYHQRIVNNAGQLFSRAVLDSYHGDRITASAVSDYFDTNLKHLPNIEQEVRRKARADMLSA
jgi:Zn-dependent peptidase ImmA (M78 family)